MYKKLSISCFLAVIVAVGFALYPWSDTFDGYRYSLEKEREASGYYNDYDYLFTVPKDDYIVDLIIDGDNYKIITIYIRGKKNKQYNVKFCSTGSITASLYNSNKLDEYYWIEHGNKPFKKSVLIVSKAYNDSHDKLNGFEFEYRGEPHILCYKFGD